MSYYLENIAKFLTHNVLIHIYSSPSFVMETCLSVIMCIFHILLIIEVNDAIQVLNLPPPKIKRKQSVIDTNSTRSIIKDVVHNHPELGVDVVFKESNVVRGKWDTTSKINKILSTTLSEYIRRDLQRRIKPKLQIESGDEENASNSNNNVENLYDYFLSEQNKCLLSEEPSL